jgi:ATP-dependent Clp protease ATP-binding subunit ClpA
MEARNAKTIPEELPFLSEITRPSIEVIGREDEIKRLTEILYKTRMQNCVLIGEAGVGKTTLVEEVARRMKKTHEFVVMDISNVQAGTKFRGTFEQKFMQTALSISRYENNFHKKVVIFIDEVHTIYTAGSLTGESTDLTAANILKPYIADGRITVWGATTLDEYKATIMRDKALMRRMPPIIINELDDEISRQIVEEFIKGSILDDGGNTKSLAASVMNFSKTIQSGSNPDKALELADRAIAKKTFEKQDSFTAVRNAADDMNAERRFLSLGI